MTGANHLDEFDKKPLHLCPVCLRKLHISAKFDVIERGRRLLSLYQEFGWVEDAAWTEQWIAAVSDEGNGKAGVGPGKNNSTAVADSPSEELRSEEHMQENTMAPVSVTCPFGHRLEVKGTDADNGWACDGRHEAGGCVLGCTGFRQTEGWARFRCDVCDFDLCEDCLNRSQRTIPIEAAQPLPAGGPTGFNPAPAGVGGGGPPASQLAKLAL